MSGSASFCCVVILLFSAAHNYTRGTLNTGKSDALR